MATHNLDDSVNEYFEFSIGGNTYRFRQPNTEESYQFNKLKDEPPDKIQAFLFTFITPVSADAPPFPSVAKKMILPQWRNFNAMLMAEFK